MGQDIIFDFSRAHVVEIPSRLTVRGGEVFEAEVEVLDPPELSSAVAGDTVVDLAWTASTSEEVTGYKVKYGTETGVYTVTEDVGNTLEHQVTGLTNDTEYFFVVTAYSIEAESGVSNELSATPVLGVLVEDTFTDADGTLLSAHTPDTDTEGLGWSVLAGTFTINSNKCEGHISDESIAVIESGEAHIVITCKLTAAATNSSNHATPAIAFRASDVDNLWIAAINSGGGNFQLYQKETGTYTSRDVVEGLSIVSGTEYPLTVTLSGTSITAVLEIGGGEETLSFSSSFNQAETKHGLRTAVAGTPPDNPKADDFKVKPN